MGIFFIVFIVIILVILLISKLKIPTLQKIFWSVVAVIVVFSLIFYWFIRGFERGRDKLAPTEEELNQPTK
ncbi:hypothetical protein [Chryseobacterium sp. c4a]|uniref:hypothetical protein n=1 Tax=Chryseobacterium sp. c4a TaxID=1573582 RepID=UPI00135C0A15|nr:hypothetical protein [Chryseobacterium sp. c4a]